MDTFPSKTNKKEKKNSGGPNANPEHPECHKTNMLKLNAKNILTFSRNLTSK